MNKFIPKYHFRKGLRHECEVIDLEHFCASNRKIILKPHRTNFNQLFYFHKAKGIHTVDFEDITLADNSLLFAPKDTVHRFDDKAEVSGVLLLFTDNFFCSNSQDSILLRNCVLHSNITQSTLIHIPEQNTVFDNVFGQIYREFDNEKDSVQADILRNYIRLLLLHFIREQISLPIFRNQSDNQDFELVRAFEYMLEQHYNSSPQVAYYCQSLNVTEKRLQTATRNILDRSPKEIIKDRIVLEAKRLLVYSSDSVKEISFRLGFDEPTNFTKFFKKSTGKSPMDFRSSQKND